MAFAEKILAQQAATASAVSMYSPAADTVAVIKTICIALLDTTAARTLTFYLDDDGTTYAATTTLFTFITPATHDNSEIVINCFIPMNNSSGNLAIEASNADTYNVTLLGVEIT